MLLARLRPDALMSICLLSGFHTSEDATMSPCFLFAQAVRFLLDNLQNCSLAYANAIHDNTTVQ